MGIRVNWKKEDKENYKKVMMDSLKKRLEIVKGDLEMLSQELGEQGENIFLRDARTQIEAILSD